MTEKELMLAERLYLASDPEIHRLERRAKQLVQTINNWPEDRVEGRMDLFRELLGSLGEDSWIEPPFRADFGCNTYIGKCFYANYECIITDVAKVTIGDHVFFGPRVSLFTAGHPIDAGVRSTKLEYGKEIHIGNHVWIGGHTVVNPGVTIGDNVVIGSGSVVTRDIPSGVVAAGVPCRVLRPITEEDRIYWQSEADFHNQNVTNP